MKITKALVLVAALAGAALLYYAFVNGGDENWEPLRVAYPERSRQLRAPFRIAEGGRFELTLKQPASLEEQRLLHREKPPMRAGGLTVTIRGTTGVRQYHVDRFVNSGWSDVNLFSSDTLFELPGRGKYVLTMVRATEADPFLERGPSVSLERVADPVSLGLGYFLAKWLGIACCMASALGVIRIVRADSGTPASSGP